MSPAVRSSGSWLARRAENVAAAMLGVMFAAFLVQIFFRYVMNFPVGWTQELSVVLWLWLVLWGASVAPLPF
jgi:TRAP-type C4-dicarboxylate transport system permease small subunit